jgi:uncharacterized protein (DUF1499 family)
MLIFRTLLKLVIVLIVVGAIAIGVLGRERLLALVLGPVTYTPIEFETLQRPASPNQYLVCPPERCTAKPDATSPVYHVPRAVLKKAWLQLMAAQPRVVHIGISPDANQYDFMQRSQWLRFPDIITVKFIDLATNQSTLAVYSRSNYGYSDLGVNRKRVESWLKDLDQHLATQTN